MELHNSQCRSNSSSGEVGCEGVEAHGEEDGPSPSETPGERILGASRRPGYQVDGVFLKNRRTGNGSMDIMFLGSSSAHVSVV